MPGVESEIQPFVFALRLAATLFFVAANGFFVAAEFALVKVRSGGLTSLAATGSRPAALARHMHDHLNLYLSACQLGVTLSSLILGWLAEPAIAELLLAGVRRAGWQIGAADRVLHGTALAIALIIITVLHMTFGEQAPKIWAIHRADSTVLFVARPLQVFANLFRPFIWAINEMSNGMLRLAGLSAAEVAESSHNVSELRAILAASADEGHISKRQVELADNVLGLIALEVRHIMVPRVDAVFLSLQSAAEDNVRIVGASGHSRFPLCRVGLDSVIGIVHAKDVMKTLLEHGELKLETLAREVMFVSDTQPLSSLIVRMQRGRNHCAVVLDEHGTAVGLAFLEDALEEIVGPLGDEFDEAETDVQRRPDGSIEMIGELALPEAATELGLTDLPDDTDTIGGYIVAELGRLPRVGDQVRLGRYQVKVTHVERNRIAKLVFFKASPDTKAPPAEPGDEENRKV